uniref:SFRICE_027961 n=1 Tax=Spodoptera frugiperda TaxID=7108 RepID=A0A2H1WXB3_SPOFR
MPFVPEEWQPCPNYLYSHSDRRKCCQCCMPLSIWCKIGNKLEEVEPWYVGRPFAACCADASPATLF